METAFGFQKAGATAELVHINRIIAKEKSLADYQILAIPGGFSYGDDIASGKIFANELRYKLKEDINKFIVDGKLIIGICNGFQILVKSGFLPGNEDLNQDASLVINDSGKFEDRWTYLKRYNSGVASTRCVWTDDLDEIIYLPVAHGEGKFIAKDSAVLEKLKQDRRIVFQYCNQDGELAGYPDNPNGSKENIAGICDQTGRVFGLMPHPERHLDKLQHPRWMSLKNNKREGDGFAIFKNGVEYARKNL
jgi:phosphoribosylformylglycinamidine synthase